MNILKNTQGFTLIEALIAMIVLTIGILALNTMQITSILGNATANKLTIASATGSNSFERLLNLPYDHSALDPAGNPHNETELTGLQLPTGVTSISWNVTEWTNTDGLNNDGDKNTDGTDKTDESDELNIKLVNLNVHYTNRLAKTLTISFYKSELF